MNSIRLSDKHGVNPTIPKCFFCGNDKSEVLLMGKLKGDVEAPHNAVFDKEPCVQCLDLMTKGVICISVKDGESGDNPYRTGGWVVVSEEGIGRMLEGVEVLADILKARCTFLPDAAWDALGLPRGEVEGIPNA